MAASPPPTSPSAGGPPPSGPGTVELPRALQAPYRLFQWFLATPRRRNFYIKTMRAVLIIGMLGLVTMVVVPELTNTAMPAPDSLTFSQAFTIAPYNSTAVAGLVDGDDVVAGNFSVTTPHGGPVVFYIILPGNGTWNERYPQAVYALPSPASASPVTFTAAYTDWYTFVWTNPTNSTVSIYVSFSYLSSAPPA